MFTKPYQKDHPRFPEKGGGVTKTEQRGYIPPNVQIQRFMDAGVRLRAARAEEYDARAEDEVDPEPDPFRAPGFDLSDASRIAQGLRERMGAAVEAANAPEATPEAPVSFTSDEVAKVRELIGGKGA